MMTRYETFLSTILLPLRQLSPIRKAYYSTIIKRITWTYLDFLLLLNCPFRKPSNGCYVVIFLVPIPKVIALFMLSKEVKSNRKKLHISNGVYSTYSIRKERVISTSLATSTMTYYTRRVEESQSSLWLYFIQKISK